MTLEKRSISSPAEMEALPADDETEYGTLSVFEIKNLPGSWPENLSKIPAHFHRATPEEAQAALCGLLSKYSRSK